MHVCMCLCRVQGGHLYQGIDITHCGIFLCGPFSLLNTFSSASFPSPITHLPSPGVVHRLHYLILPYLTLPHLTSNITSLSLHWTCTGVVYRQHCPRRGGVREGGEEDARGAAQAPGAAHTRGALFCSL